MQELVRPGEVQTTSGMGIIEVFLECGLKIVWAVAGPSRGVAEEQRAQL
jgi:hypothetical protein